MGYRITKLVFDSEQGISCLEIQDERGNTAFTLNGQNKAVSDPDKDNLIELPELNKDTLEFNNKKKPSRSAADRLKDFCSRKKTEPGVNIKCLTKFFEFYSKRLGSWKGDFRVEDLYSNWLARERNN